MLCVCVCFFFPNVSMGFRGSCGRLNWIASCSFFFVPVYADFGCFRASFGNFDEGIAFHSAA